MSATTWTELFLVILFFVTLIWEIVRPAKHQKPAASSQQLKTKCLKAVLSDSKEILFYMYGDFCNNEINQILKMDLHYEFIDGTNIICN